MEPKESNHGNTSQTSHRAQLTRLILKLEREDEDLVCSQAYKDPLPINAENIQETSSRRAIACGTLFLVFILLSFFFLIRMGRDSRPAELPQWQPIFSLAEVAREKGELYDAKELYSQAGTFAASRDDWAGLLAATCGLNKLKQDKTPYSAIDALLLRAMAAAETKQSRTGLVAVAKAFTLLGNNRWASIALSRVRKNWTPENNRSTDLVPSGCWENPSDPNDG
jgi:hypothetical protein